MSLEYEPGADGVKMHGGREVDYGGCSIVSGDAVLNPKG